MTDKDEAARQKAKALACWEGEGGALARPDAALLRSRARRDLSKTPQACYVERMPRASSMRSNVS